jgi:hypothetical protein
MVKSSANHSKTKPFDFGTLLDHSGTRKVQYSDGYCTTFLEVRNLMTGHHFAFTIQMAI